MKSIITLVTLVVSMNVHSQVITSDKNINFIASPLTVSNSPLIYAYDSNKHLVDIYDEDFSIRTSFSIPTTPLPSKSYYEEAIVDAALYDAGKVNIENIQWTINNSTININEGSSSSPKLLYYCDYDNVCSLPDYILFTQSFFNDDSKIEYLMPQYNGIEKKYWAVNIKKGKNDGSAYAAKGQYLIERYINEQSKLTGFNVINEDGVTLYSIPTTSTNEGFKLVVLNGQKYVATRSELFEISSQTNSVNPVIESKPANAKKLKGIYDQNGESISSEKTGVNIILYNDGSTMKILK